MAEPGIPEHVWSAVQDRLGYSEEDMALFRGNPRNEEVLRRTPELMSKTIVAEVVESHGCNSGHEVGDRFVFDGAGNVISKLCPKRMCVYALAAVAPLIFTSNELLYAGVDPSEMRFNRLGCPDVGVRCGGWGRVVMELKVADR
ncbi:MAG: TIGR04076 family protein [Acidobacteria bacterium]|nr:TIGR04076 family protein [Acidobacteriota bacterium]